MRENLAVQEGDTLLLIKNEVLQKNINTQKNKEQEYIKLIEDAKRLCALNEWQEASPNLLLQTPFYKQSLLSVQEQSLQIKQRLGLLRKKYVRLKNLRDEKLIPAQEFEAVEQELTQTEKEIPLLIEKTKNQI